MIAHGTTILVAFDPDNPTTWTDLTADVLDGVSCNYGIQGSSPLDRVASTGTLRFRLNNSRSNAGGKQGYYSPNHTNCRQVSAHPWDIGLAVRWYHAVAGAYAERYLFTGTIATITPEPGIAGAQYVTVDCVDWFDAAAQETLHGQPVEASVTTPNALQSLLANMATPLGSGTWDVGESTFTNVFADGQDEVTTCLAYFAALIHSEGGYFWATGAGLSQYRSRTWRQRYVGHTLVVQDTMTALQATKSRNTIINAVQVTVHPKRIDLVGTTVLWSRSIADGDPAIALGGGLTNSTIFGGFGDPLNAQTRCGGTDMITPVATTDYLMNRSADGTGDDLTANLTATASYGGNGVRWTLTNAGAEPGYITLLQCRGRGVYDSEPIAVERTDAASIALYGKRPATVDMPMQQDGNVATSEADFLMTALATANALPQPTRLTYLATSAATLMTGAMAVEVGDLVQVYETVTGVGFAAPANFYVNACQFDLQGGHLWVTYTLCRSVGDYYFTLDSSSYGDIDLHARLGY